MLRACLSRFPLAALAAVLASAPLAAQTTTPAPAAAQPAAPPPLSVSGLIFGSYNYQLSTTPAQLANQNDNGFIVDRAYLNFRAPAGDRLSIRVTTDVYQTTEAAANAYTIRAKYAFLQYDVPRSPSGAAAFARLGILQNVVIEHIEGFWPRYLSQTAIERAGFFSSADVGVAAGYTLPSKMGELYGTITNGPGYTSRERDRFKDFALRLSLTPLANQVSTPLLQTFTITGWGYKGAIASSFVNSGAGQVGAVGKALDRSRAGVFVGLKDPRLVLGGEFAMRHDGGETGANTAASPRVETTTTGRVLSGFTQIRPFAFTNGTGKSPFGIVARYDRVSPSTATTNITTPPPSDNSYHNLIGGVFYDVNQRAQFALDYQESLASNNGLSAAPPAQSKGYYLHFMVNF
ncbi:MAG: hypothetical protein HOQ17_10245 [Gemmatimonadaceae bacterium]|nr:hypothetical protein [Gemmatimonadaceae bacterium]NUO94165.1 hypothetical protein [Gemmatimonadaceae bacterium]NUP55382.1 hypothetical protein [Gemmatimonadaceae bacterium]NUS33430.1 hypothetical protein [Gemmatimonadaceae bacterium]